MIPVEHYLFVSLVLFCIGVTIIVVKRNAIVVLMGIELMLNAANINLVAFSQGDTQIKGQMFAIFVMVVAAAEAAVTLAIILMIYQHYKTVNIDEANKLKG